jgi:transcriptional regulator with GAF, ATPase, and Fis domain
MLIGIERRVQSLLQAGNYTLAAPSQKSTMKIDQEPAADMPQDIVVADPKMLEVIAAARNVAAHNAAVLVTGETGVGKEFVARLIHEHSPRRARPWVDLNCAALPEHLVESELFGYEKGAFSGADAAKPGMFEMANGGTLLLDEIGDLDPKIQVKLLRVLDGNSYYRLGGSRKVSVDIRLVAAINRDLKSCVREGSFRSDLYHRISEVQLRVPPLRERPQDILALARHFLERCRSGATFSPQALQLLLSLEWRGNVRELRNLVLELGILSSQSEITVDQIRQYVSDPTEGECDIPVSPAPPEVVSMAAMEREMIVQALELTDGNQTLAARHLGIPRRTFCRKLNQLHIERRRKAPATSGTTAAFNHRRELEVPVQITTDAGCGLVGMSRNISPGGLGLQGVLPCLKADEALTVAFTLPGLDQPMILRAAVVWSQPNGTAGIRFIELKAETVGLLHDWIAGGNNLLRAGKMLIPTLPPETIIVAEHVM